ncbi:MAG: AAA family ATPase [Candidatus Buchananbacteria bacterium]|nr:AAA family ATPase [Candidatus Buchananbacteria bacterium]
MKPKIIIGLIGELAAGKGTITRYLKENHQAVSFRFSDPLRETLNIFDLDVSRENMQNISTMLRTNFGENILAKAIAKKVREGDDNFIVIDGVRRHTDLENLSDVPGFNLVYITADQKIRHDRYVKRNENVGDDKMTFADFQIKEQAEADRQIPEVAKSANYKINNDGSLEQLYQQIEDTIKKINEN